MSNTIVARVVGVKHVGKSRNGNSRFRVTLQEKDGAITVALTKPNSSLIYEIRNKTYVDNWMDWTVGEYRRHLCILGIDRESAEPAEGVSNV